MRRVRLLLREVELPSLDVYLAETYLLQVSTTAAETADEAAATPPQHARSVPHAVGCVTDTAEGAQEDGSLMSSTREPEATRRSSAAETARTNSTRSDSATAMHATGPLFLSLPQRLLHGSKHACYCPPETSRRTSAHRHVESGHEGGAPELHETEDDLTSGAGLHSAAQTSPRVLLLPPRPQPPHSLGATNDRPRPSPRAELLRQPLPRRASVEEHRHRSAAHDTQDAIAAADSSPSATAALSLATEMERALTAYKAALAVALRAVRHREAVWTALQQFLHIVRTEVAPGSAEMNSGDSAVAEADIPLDGGSVGADGNAHTDALHCASAPDARSEVSDPTSNGAAARSDAPRSPSIAPAAIAAAAAAAAAPPRLRLGKAHEGSVPGASEGRTEAGLTPRGLSSSASAAGSEGGHGGPACGAVDAQVADHVHDCATSTAASLVELPAAGDAAATAAARGGPAPRRPQRPSLRLALDFARPPPAPAATGATTPTSATSISSSAPADGGAPGRPSPPSHASTRPISPEMLLASTATSIHVPPLLLPRAGSAAGASTAPGLAQTARPRSGFAPATPGATRSVGRRHSAMDRPPATSRALSAAARRGPAAPPTIARSRSGAPVVSAAAARRATALRDLFPALCTPLPLPVPRSHSAPGSARTPIPPPAAAAPPSLSPRPPRDPSSATTPRSRMLTRDEAHTSARASAVSTGAPPLRLRLRAVSRDVYAGCLLHYLLYVQRTTLAVVEAVGELRRRHLCHPAPLVVEHRNYLLEVLLQTGTLVEDETVRWLMREAGSDGPAGGSGLETSHVSGGSRNTSSIKSSGGGTPDVRRPAAAHHTADSTLSLTHEGEQAGERAAQRATQVAAVRGQWPEQLLRTPLLSGHPALTCHAVAPPFLGELACWCGSGSSAGDAGMEGMEAASCSSLFTGSLAAAAVAECAPSRAAPPPPPPASLLLLPTDVLTTYCAATGGNGGARQRHPPRPSTQSRPPSAAAAAALRRRLEAAERALHAEVAAQLEFLQLRMRCALQREYPLHLRGMADVQRRFFAIKLTAAHRRPESATGSGSGGVRYDRVSLNDELMRGDWMEELQVSWQLLMSGSSSIE